MWFKTKREKWILFLNERFKAIIIIFVTISLTALALLLANKFSEQRSKNILTFEALKYKSALIRKSAA